MGGGKEVQVSSTACEPDWTVSVHVPHEQASTAQVRWRMAADLHAAGVLVQDADDALLILSELLTNAVRHARSLPGGGLLASWTISPTHIGVSVTDGGSSTAPVATAADMSAIGGRGLHIVRLLASSWNVTRGETNTTVWAIIARAAIG
jgi:anti-sigma regulatory factor (Ser/Thr protein kinase)